MNFRNNLRRRSVAIVAAATAATAATGTGEAHAWTNYYCGASIYGYSWCGDGSDHTYDSNQATGSGTVCERMLWANQPWVVNGVFCGPGTAGRYYGPNSASLYEAEVTHSNGAVRYIVNGMAVA